MSAEWTSGVCVRCRAPVVVGGAEDDPTADYLWRCPVGHFDEATGDTETPWWVRSADDPSTEQEILADARAYDLHVAARRAAILAGDITAADELLRAERLRRATVGPSTPENLQRLLVGVTLAAASWAGPSGFSFTIEPDHSSHAHCFAIHATGLTLRDAVNLRGHVRERMPLSVWVRVVLR